MLVITSAILSACSGSGGHSAATTRAAVSAHTGKIVNGRWDYGSGQARLPIGLATHDARQVVTITATSLLATTATGQAWQRTSHGWQPYGPRFVAHLGNGGLSANERESSTSTPIGSFTLTQAFGRMPNPGTRLPYFQTTPADWWISQPGTLYNTHQVCAVPPCRFITGSPNAQLFYVRPQYDLAVVIDYNRAPAVQGAGSGIFLHVTSGRPTNGCVSIPVQDLEMVMRWLEPTQQPRILIGAAT
jgi:L,D-peptidoglycan transpeptidase YkuD (ErfK/YbiS/YcfS/YnhG family)